MAKTHRRKKISRIERRAVNTGGAIDRAMLDLRNPYAPVAQFSEDQIEAIHRTSLRILSHKGIRVLSAPARAVFHSAGAQVDDTSRIVRFDPDLVMQAIAAAPSRCQLRARNAVRSLEIGSNAVVFATVGGPPNVTDLDSGRRPGSMESSDNLLRLAQSFDVVHLLAPMVEPVDVHISMRHLEVARSTLTLTDKPSFVFSRGHEAVADVFEMIKLGYAIDDEEFDRGPVCYTVVNANSPLQLDDSMCKGIMDFARRNQLMILTPFTLAGAMAPVTIPGALAQQNAEALAGITLAQLVRPGAPVCYGGFTSNVDMKSGAPAFGTPEYVKAAFASGQLARRYGLPFRSSNVNASNAPDVQSVYESQMSMWGAIMGGCNVLLHGAGWLEGGLSASFEKFVIDVEMLQMFAQLMRPEVVDDDTLAFAAIEEVEPGGHYFGAAHTLARYDTAFYEPMLSDWRNFETWEEAGSIDATHRANQIWKRKLAEYEPPALEVSRREAIDEFVARRKAEGGADLEK